MVRNGHSRTLSSMGPEVLGPQNAWNGQEDEGEVRVPIPSQFLLWALPLRNRIGLQDALIISLNPMTLRPLSLKKAFHQPLGPAWSPGVWGPGEAMKSLVDPTRCRDPGRDGASRVEGLTDLRGPQSLPRAAFSIRCPLLLWASSVIGPESPRTLT